MSIRWERDPTRPVQVGFVVDHTASELTVVHLEDVEPVLEANVAAYNDFGSSARGKDEWRMWARIPPGIAAHWKAQYGVDVLNPEHWPTVKRLLHDPSWRKLRVAPGSYLDRPTREHFLMDSRSAQARALVGASARAARSRPVRSGGI